MLRSMDSAVAGLRAHQNKLDVIGNNISNVNTFGFKAQNFAFKEAMYQTATASTGGEDGGKVAGGNAAQYGYGTMMGSITTDMGTSTPTFVGGFNACINGPGFFITKDTAQNGAEKDTVQDGEGIKSDEIKKTNFKYTRVGQFSIDANGYIVDANKNFVYGFRPNNLSEPTEYGGVARTLAPLRAPGNAGGNTVDLEGDANWEGEAVKLSGLELDNEGVIKGIVDNGNGKVSTIIIGRVAIAGFQNQDGLTKAGGNYFVADTNDNSGKAMATFAGGGGSTLMSGYLEGSNVDLAKEFADMIATQRGFQANSKIITVSDEILNELVNMKR